ncbi:MAG: hypothetical protein ACLUOI_01815 [Eisenbergiella sp.]
MTLASRLMNMHYCEGNKGGAAPEFTWIGAGEEQHAADRESVAIFRQFGEAIPACDIWDEKHDVTQPARGYLWFRKDVDRQRQEWRCI